MNPQAAQRKLTAEQREVVLDDSPVLAVAASAGSGKTFALTERVVHLALGPAAPDGSPAARELDLARVLVVTFTRAAANSLRERLVSRLNRELHETQALAAAGGAHQPALHLKLQRLRQQLAVLPLAQISTIHSFCQEILRRYGHTIGFKLGRLMDELETQQLKHELATEYLDQALGPDASPSLRQMALAWGGLDGVGPEDLSQVQHATGLRGIVLALSGLRSALVDPERWFREHHPGRRLAVEEYDAAHPLVVELVADLHAWAASWLAQFEDELARFSAGAPEAPHVHYLQRRIELLRELTAAQEWPQFAPVFAWLQTKHDGKDGRPKLPQHSAPASSWLGRIDDEQLKGLAQASTKQFKAGIEQWAQVVNCPWQAWAQRENTILDWVEQLWRLADGFERVYAAFKAEHETADFNDLERRALQILAESPALQQRPAVVEGLAASDTAVELARYYQAVLVDEYQDVNPLQHAMLKLVAAGDRPFGHPAGSYFAVGDIKQSIYGFRQAEPQIFSQLQAELRRSSRQPDPGEWGRVLPLRVNFRSTPQVLRAVNHIFRGLMSQGFGGEDYTQDSELRPPAASRQPTGADPGEEPRGGARLHVVLTDAAPNGAEDEEEAEDYGRDEVVYRRVAQVLRELRASDRYAWREMVVLVRSAANQLELLRRVLLEQGVPTYAASRTGFYERPEVADVLALLAVIDNPRQDVPLAAVLRGPAVGLQPAELLELALIKAPAAAYPGPLWERLQLARGEQTLTPALLERVERFVRQLEHWQSLARQLALPDLVWRLYAETGLINAAGALYDGQQRIANLIALHEMARAAGGSGAGLARFLAFVRGSREAKGDTGEASVLSEADDVVQVLTVHQAKGLEFPVVVLAYLHRKFNLDSAKGQVLWHKALGLSGVAVDLAEGLAAGSGASAVNPQARPAYKYLKAQQALQRDAKAEELRLLYVALTRAQARLEIVVPATAQELAPTSMPLDPVEAKHPWDWLKRQLAPLINQIDCSQAANAQCEGEWAEAGWSYVAGRYGETGDPASDGVEAAGGPAGPSDSADKLPELTPVDLDGIRRRLEFRYPYSGATILPFKAVVTQITAAAQAQRPPAEEDQPAELDLAPPPAGGTAAYGGGSADGSEAADLGTLVHRVMALVDLRQPPAFDALAAILNSLPAPEALKQAVPLGQLVGMIERLQQEFDGFRGAHVRQEYPLTMLLPPDSIPPLAAAGQGAPHPADRVLVQGIIDVLAVWPDRALVLDYKLSQASAGLLRQRYGSQLAWYAAAVRALLPQLPAERVTAVICGIGAGTIVPVT